MAVAAKVEDDDDIPLIEEHVETGLAALLDTYKPNYVPGGSEIDELDERYRVEVNQPMPELSNEFAKAYNAKDLKHPHRNIYGVVFEPSMPYRAAAVAPLEGTTNPNIALPLSSGIIRCSHVGEARYVMFFDKPQGTLLADLIAGGTRIPESRINDLILKPLVNGLMVAREKKIHHGNIHPGMIYVGENTQFGECFTAYAGTLAHYVYEPLERLMADKLGHGEANEKADVYALGIIVYELMYGLDKFKSMPRQEFIERMIRQGAYQLFGQGRDFQDPTQDLFRGVLNDNAADRWTLDQLQQYTTGKRFNMILPSQPKDASRPFIFGEESIFSRRVLASVLQRNWKEAVKSIKALRLDRWCELSLHRPELAERIERAVRIGADVSAGERQSNEMMTRIFVILDPTAPIRTKNLAFRPDSTGLMLASLLGTKGPELTQLINIMQSNILSFWAEQSEQNKTPEMSQYLWHLQRVSHFLDMRAIGFGMERVLYELNPSLPCQSPLLKAYHITTAIDALQTLDALAKSIGPNGSLIDRHLAGFIAAKIDLAKEVRLGEFTNIPAVAENPELIMMWLLAKAQQKHPKLKLVGLCAWSGMRIDKILDQIHNRVVRKRQKLLLKRLASTGFIREVVLAVLNRDVISNDTDGFAQAMALYDIHDKQIEYLEKPIILQYKSRKAGGRMAVNISCLALTVMGYITLANLLGI